MDTYTSPPALRGAFPPPRTLSQLFSIWLQQTAGGRCVFVCVHTDAHQIKNLPPYAKASPMCMPKKAPPTRGPRKIPPAPEKKPCWAMEGKRLGIDDLGGMWRL